MIINVINVARQQILVLMVNFIHFNMIIKRKCVIYVNGMKIHVNIQKKQLLMYNANIEIHQLVMEGIFH